MKIRSTSYAWILALSLASCTVTQPFQKKKESVVTDVQLRTKLLEYVDSFSSIVQRAADTVASRSDDPAVRRTTVAWKLRTIPLCRHIVLDKEPREAFLDLWAMAIQIEDYVTEGEGATRFGGFGDELAAAGLEAVAGIEAVARSILDEADFDRARSEVEEFAREHPITGSFVRQSQLPSSSGESAGKGFSWVGSIPVIGAFEGIDEGARAVREVGQVVDRFTRTTAAMPEELRWQYELMLYDFEARGTVIETRQAVQTTSQAFASIADTAARLPADVDQILDKSFTQLETQNEGLQATLREADTVLSRGEGVAGSLERTAESLARAGVALEGMAVAFMGPPEEPGVSPPPAAEPETEGEADEGGGFDIEAYARTADSITQGAAELRALVSDLQGAAGSDELDTLLAGTGSRVDELIERATRAALTLVAAILVAALGYRFVSVRWMSGRMS